MSGRRQSIPAHWLSGLTFGEMLIVLAVFSLLATMFLISSQFAMVKSKLSRTLHDEREVTGRLDLYVADNGEIPSNNQGLNSLLRGPNGIAYMDRVPPDPFAPQINGKPSTFLYFTNLSSQLQSVVVSVGPDGQSDIGPALDELRKHAVVLSGVATGPQFAFTSPKQVQDFVTRYSYDPTNGSVSAGDVINYYSAPNVVIAH